MGVHALRAAILVVGAAGTCLSGCVTMPEMGEPTLSAGERRYEQESSWLSKSLGRTDVQGAVAGAVIGGLACAMLGGKTKTCMAAAGGGAVAGYAAGAALNANRQRQAQKLSGLDAALAQLRDENTKAERMLAAQRAVVEEQLAEIGRIKKAYSAKSIDLREAQRQLAAVKRAAARQQARNAELRKVESAWRQRLQVEGASPARINEAVEPMVRSAAAQERGTEQVMSTLNDTYMLIPAG